MTAHPAIMPAAGKGMPPRQPLPMPSQDLARAPAWTRRGPAPVRVIAARIVAFGGAALLTGFATREMVAVVSASGVTPLECLMTAIFAVCFAWTAFAATTALAGLVTPPRKHVRLDRTGGRLRSRTALVMPIYNEDPAQTTAALQAMAEALHEAGEAGAFEIVVLSDSDDPDAWVGETVAMERLAARLGAVMPVWYRRRWVNTGRKAGNLRQFVETWGGRYHHMVVLDADSLMSAAALITLAAAMEADPQLGILQSVPVLTGGGTLFARLQQVASRVHGPVTARGLAAWQGSDGNYWGHNAIVRTAAFAQCCGLPDLRGRQPFGGPILSHDFVEAALMRRAGWRVEMTPRLEGSWEGTPPSLVDVAIRDRRWAQGNLQHSKVLGARGLAWCSRAHLVMGILSYLVAPLWLALIAAGFALSIQAEMSRPDYFPDGAQLFPVWPHLDAERLVRLFFTTLLLLLLPKLLGLAWALWRSDLRKGCGGAAALVASFCVEVLASALYAPVMMAIHTKQLCAILWGRDAGWRAQRRSSGETRWREAWQWHRWDTLLGALIGLSAFRIGPATLAWMAPTVIGLCLAAPLSRASGSNRLGELLGRARLLRTPEETEQHPVMARRAAYTEEAAALQPVGFTQIATDPTVRTAHFKRAASPSQMAGEPDPDFLTARAKIRDASNMAEALAWLTRRERLHVAANQSLAELLANLPQDGWTGPGRAWLDPRSSREARELPLGAAAE